MGICASAGIKYFELPIAYDALVVAVNKNNTWVNEITIEDLKKIWAPEAQGKVMKWNQVRGQWPDAKINLFGAGSDSGTFDYFTEAVAGKAKASRGDYTSSEDDNTLVLGISNDKNALGYLPYSYYIQNASKMRALGIIGGEKAPVKKAVAPSKESVENGSYFPLSRPLFIYINADSAKKPEVKEFVEFYIKNGGELATQVKYVSLPQKSTQMILDQFTKGKMGTVFAGENVIGLKIEDLLKREAKH
jgi:phosphate transport system substrate-binding protein